MGVNAFGLALSQSFVTTPSPFSFSTLPSPMTTAAMCESGARSPLAETVPKRGTAGVTLLLSMSIKVSTSTGRATLWPRASDAARISIVARTTVFGANAPTPAQCERIRLR